MGSPFYVMEFVEGTPYRTADQLAPLGPERTRAAVLNLVDTLVELHAVDPAAVGLGDFGRPEGFLTASCAAGPSSWTPPATATWPASTSCTPPSAGNRPRSPAPTVVHGDYRLDNVLIGGDRDEINAILDWEMSTLGDLLTDLGLLVMLQHAARHARLCLHHGPGPRPPRPRRADRAVRRALGARRVRRRLVPRRSPGSSSP
ncbi:phosphotransferase family protein [Streptomyces thinghirensis]|nr:phosphotransferase family protein [Streptomyces thinghirensis]